MPANLIDQAYQQADLWKKTAEKADLLEGFLESSHYQVFEDLILKPIEARAFSTLKSPELNLSDLNQLYQLRALCQSVDLIRKEIAGIIQNGKNARTLLKDLLHPKEGENA